MDKKTYIIAPLPPPKGGIAVLAEILNKNISHTYIFDSKIPDYFRNNPYGTNKSIVRRDGFKLVLQALYLIFNFIKFVYKLLLEKVSVVHIISSTGPGLYRNFIFGIITKVLNRKLIFHLVGDIESHTKNKSDLHNRSIYFLLKFFGPIIVQSDTHSLHLQDYNVDAIIVRNPSKFEDLNSYSEFNFSNHRKILTIGVFGERKGFYRIVEFIKKNSGYLRDEGYHFIFAGNGEDESNLLSSIKKAEIEDFISFFSNPDDDLLLTLYRESSCFLLPTSKDGMPLVLIDALFFGIPIVSNSVGCIKDIIVDNRLLSNDISEWENSFKVFLGLNTDQLKIIHQHNLNLYRKYYSTSNFISKFKSYYEA